MSDVDIWDDKFEPTPKLAWHTWWVGSDELNRQGQTREFHTALYVEVEPDGLIGFNDISYYMGKSIKEMLWQERREIYDYLIEWELATWRRIGPEDSELFATKKLDPDYGLEF